MRDSIVQKIAEKKDAHASGLRLNNHKTQRGELSQITRTAAIPAARKVQLKLKIVTTGADNRPTESAAHRARCWVASGPAFADLRATLPRQKSRRTGSSSSHVRRAKRAG